MAVTWTVVVNAINIPQKRVKVAAIRTENGSSKTYRINNAQVETSGQKQALWDKIWAMYQEDIGYEEDEDELCDELETDGKEDLESREE
jgi:hypothetical protein